mmetsp:Transcript_19164/g.39503  ORF Transcript_19164/g.39503 Transcript_19164/m.39503 type:complete len:1319 (-) Transcript_19164:1318-5274(-)
MKAMNEPIENHQHQISPQSSREEKDVIDHANNKHFRDEDENAVQNEDPYDISSVSEEEREDIAIAPGPISNKYNNEFTSPSWTNMSPLHRIDKHIRPPQSQPMNSKSPISPSKRHLGTVDYHIPPPSPAGSVASMASNTSQTNSKSQSTPLTMPRFYDSEDEGHGSLVFVGDEPSTSQPPTPTQSLQFRLSKTLSDSSENASGSRPTKVLSSPTKDRRDRNPPAVADTNPAKMLPYHQRRKLNMTEQQPDHPPSPPDSSPAADVDISPGVSGERKSLTQIRPPFHPKPSSVPRDKYKIAQIPPFRGSDGGQESRQSTADSSEHDSFVRKATNSTSPQSSPEKILENTRPPLSRSSSPKHIRSSSSTHDVICPPQPPIPQPPSPRSGGYHIRIQSQGSISSLGSHAGVDSDCEYTNAPPFQHITQQQMQQNSLPSNYYHGYSQEQQSTSPPPPTPVDGPQRNIPKAPSVNFNDVLGQDIATFLHGEQIAAATGNVGRQQMGAYPHPSHWNPSYGGVHPGWIGGNPYNSNLYYYPAARPEPPPPPLTAVPNMNLHRARLPSISDDDWAEELDKINKEQDEGEEAANEFDRKGQTQRNKDRRNAPPPPPPLPEYYHHQLPPTGYYSNQNQVARDYYNQHPDFSYPEVSLGGLGDQYNRIISQDWRLRSHESHNYYQYPQQASIQGDYAGKCNRGAPGVSNEGSSLLAHSNMNPYESRDGNNGMVYNRGNYHSHENYPGNMDTKSRQEAERERRRRKKKSKRRREKEKRRTVYSSDSSQEGESEKRSRGKRSHRKNRKGKREAGDVNSEGYSESLMTRSVEEAPASRTSNGNIFQRFLLSSKLLVCNLPLSAASISFTIVLLGTVWLKWTKESLSTCKEVNFHSSQCTLPDFPGCYFCDEFNHVYQLATRFHSVSSYVAGITVMAFFAKAVLSWNAFIDEISSPTTASPAGLIFMTMALSFIGKGDIGEILVLVASFLHLILVVWFIYMSLAYQTMPDPSWFPNTIGIGLCAVKVWFYYPLAGHFLIAITLMLTFLYFPISLIRVALNTEKMSSTICWMQMICPAISLYALSIIIQPSFFSETPDITHFQALQRTVYLPCMTSLFVLSVVGMLSSVHGVIMRWSQICQEEFSPAHAAYSFPLLVHALAVQSFRSGLDFFGGPGVSLTFKSVLHAYWVFLVVAGTLVALICIVTYLAFLPFWTVEIHRENEEEPPSPHETSICDVITFGEALIQPYVSPAILQANETGILITAHDSRKNKCYLVRTRKIPALGFEPMMDLRKFARERDALKIYIGQPNIQEVDEDGNDQETENGEFLDRSDVV